MIIHIKILIVNLLKSINHQNYFHKLLKISIIKYVPSKNLKNK
jgi:hypothetical protein